MCDVDDSMMGPLVPRFVPRFVPRRPARALSFFGGGPPDSALPGGVVGEGERWIDEEDARRRTQEILARCEALHQKLQPLNERLRGPLERNSEDTMMLPFVLLLGNHSSGKSSFLNHVLERRIQTAGVAPTDDSFTIVSPGPADIDQDGPALVGDPDMGFQGLRQYGPGLIHHMQLKIRADVSTSQFMIVDSPGMIDSPLRGTRKRRRRRLGPILRDGGD